MKKQIKFTTISTIILMIILGIFTIKSWASLSFMTPGDASHSYFKSSTNPIHSSFSNSDNQKRSHAPEPTTLALVGGSILGMIVNFIRKTYSVGKRIFDVTTSILAILFLSPLFIFAALLIKLTSRGPIFFFQERVGLNGQIFKIYKFRTMRVNAEKETGPVWAASNDNRLIPCGKFLRKTHIDEIPQFVNVLKGEMSVIGPRPERPVFVEKFKSLIPDYEKRLQVKPGITGLAQVWHKYDETIDDVRKKIKYDLLYIKKLCLWTDLRIFFRTFRVILTGEGAH